MLLTTFDQSKTAGDRDFNPRLVISASQRKAPKQKTPASLKIVFINGKGSFIEENLTLHVGSAAQCQCFSFGKANVGFRNMFIRTGQQAALEGFTSCCKFSRTQFRRRWSFQQLERLLAQASLPEIYVRQENAELVIPDGILLLRSLEAVLCFTRCAWKITMFKIMFRLRVKRSKIRLSRTTAG
jgi:hypothetical protein